MPVGAYVPANATALIYVPRGRIPIPDKKKFKVHRFDGAKLTAVSFDLKVEKEELLGEHLTLVLISPRGGFEPGARYRFAVNYGREQITEITILAHSVTHEDVQVELVAGDPTTEDVRVVSYAGDCSRQLQASQVWARTIVRGIDPRLRSSFLYSWHVEGFGAWRPTSHQCDTVAPWHSWTDSESQDLGTNLIYSACDQQSRVNSGLPHGSHLVHVTAWLPGTKLRWRAEALVELQCKGQ